MVKRLMLMVSAAILAASGLQAVQLTVRERSGIERFDEPVTSGVPLPEGRVSSVDGLVLSGPGGPVPCEFRAASRWPDGSVRWAHLDFQASLPADGELSLLLLPGSPAAAQSRLELIELIDRFVVTTGKIRAEIRSAKFNLFDGLWLDDGSGTYPVQIVAGHDRGIVLHADGVEYTSAADLSSTLELESAGAMRMVLRAEGKLEALSGDAEFYYVCRLYFFNDSPVVRVALSIENRGEFLQGFEYKAAVEGLQVEVPLSAEITGAYAGMPALDWDHLEPVNSAAAVTVSSASRLEYAVDGAVVSSMDPKTGKSDRVGWLGANLGGDAVAGVGVRWFWQMHPSSIELDAETGLLTVGLVPRSLGIPLDIYSGVGRTHYLRFAFLPSAEASRLGQVLAASQRPLLAVASPEYYCRTSGVFGHLADRDRSLYPPEYREEVGRVEDELDLGLENQWQKVDSRTKNGVTWESYGFLNWGDGMHYAWEAGVHEPLNIAWNHHYYDLPFMVMLEFVRSGNWRYYDYFTSRAVHLMDVHMVHLDPGHAYDGAGRYCPPTDHVRQDPSDTGDYTTASVYISPYTNHHKTQGLFGLWHLTGDERARDMALEGTDFVSGFGGYTDFDQPRGAAFQVLTLLEAYKSTGDEAFLGTAKTTFNLWYNENRGTASKFTGGYFMAGFLLEAFIDLYEIEQDERIVAFIKEGVDWMDANESVWFSAGGHGKYSNMALAQGWLAERLDDSSYRDLQLEYLSYWKGNWSNAFKDYGLTGRSVARSLYYLSYEGLGRQQPNRGDIDGDGQVGLTDLVELLLLGLRDPFNTRADYNDDGRYSLRDVIALLLRIRSEGGAVLAGVPYDKNRFGDISPEARRYLLAEIEKLGLTDSETSLLESLLGAAKLPGAVTLAQNHPNPFNPSTTISYGVPGGDPLLVRLEIFDIRGRLVRVLENTVREPGFYQVYWDGTDNSGRPQGSGVYFYRLNAGGESRMRKMVLVK